MRTVTVSNRRLTMGSVGLGALFGLWALIAPQWAPPPNTLQDISYSALPGNKLQIVLTTATPSGEPLSFDYMSAQFTEVIEKLLVYPEAMQRNLGRTHGLIHSQAVLLALTAKGMKREEAYRAVQDAAMKVWSEGTSFKDLLASSEPVMRHLSHNELDELFDDARAVRHVDTIFNNLRLNEGS